MSGCLAPARFFRYTAAEKDPISEVPEVPHPEADALEDLRFVVAALDEAVGPGDVHGVQNLLKPVAVRRDAGPKFRKIHNVHGREPVEQPLLPDGRGLRMHDGKELVLQPVGVGEPRGDLNHQRQTLLLLAAQSFHRLPEKVL